MSTVTIQMNLEQQNGGKYNIGLCDCFSDCKACCCAICCPCCLAGQIKAELDGRIVETCDWCLMPSQYFNRQQLRTMFHMERDSCSDFCTHYFCNCCASIQDFRELKKRKNDGKIKIFNDMFKI